MYRAYQLLNENVDNSLENIISVYKSLQKGRPRERQPRYTRKKNQMSNIPPKLFRKCKPALINAWQDKDLELRKQILHCKLNDGIPDSAKIKNAHLSVSACDLHSEYGDESGNETDNTEGTF